MEYDTHDPAVAPTWQLAFLRRRSRVLELVAAEDILVALSHSGICAAFSRGTSAPLGSASLPPEKNE
jgi:hypothetical protein